MSRTLYFPHPEDPSLISVHSRSSKFSGCDAHEKLTNRITKLQEKLLNKDQEIQELRIHNESLSKTLNDIKTEYSPGASQKIADLTKNNRHLSNQLMTIKAKIREIESRNQKLEDQLESKSKLLEEYEKTGDPVPPSPTEVQMLTENLEKVKKKLCEATNNNHQLKNDLKIAYKCLQQEIGSDSINLAQILNSNSNWRGRSQQIQMLQSKIAELKDKLESTTDSEGFDAGHLPLKRLESVRKMEIYSLTKELDECRSQFDELKQKVSAYKTRNQNLSEEAKNYKLKTLELMEKSKNDDDYIKCLNEKISMIKFEHEHKINEMEMEMDKLKQLCEDSKLEVQKHQCEMENALKLLSDKDAEIAHLKIQVEDLEKHLRDMSGDFLYSCRDMSKTEYTELVKALEQEKSNLLKFTEDLSARLNKQSIVESNQQDIIAKQRSKISRLQAKIKEFEDEKEASKFKHRRGIRISEYSRKMSGMNVNNRPATNERLTTELDRLRFKLEHATERIAYLEKKLQMQNDDREEDCQRFIEIISKSKECFKEIFQECKDLSGSFTDTSSIEKVGDSAESKSNELK